MELTFELWLGALCLWREARGSTGMAMRGIWWVILNRTTDAQGRWPKSIPRVITQHLQFSSFNSGDPNALQFPLPPVPPALASPDWAALEVSEAVVASPGDDPTNGANSYESLPPDAKKPEWCDPAKITATIGPFRFYKL